MTRHTQSLTHRNWKACTWPAPLGSGNNGSYTLFGHFWGLATTILFCSQVLKWVCLLIRDLGFQEAAIRFKIWLKRSFYQRFWIHLFLVCLILCCFDFKLFYWFILISFIEVTFHCTNKNNDKSKTCITQVFFLEKRKTFVVQLNIWKVLWHSPCIHRRHYKLFLVIKTYWEQQIFLVKYQIVRTW